MISSCNSDLPDTLCWPGPPQAGTEAPFNKAYGLTTIATVVAAPDGGLSLAGTTLRVGGWVKTGRAQGKGEFAFLVRLPPALP